MNTYCFINCNGKTVRIEGDNGLYSLMHWINIRILANLFNNQLWQVIYSEGKKKRIWMKNITESFKTDNVTKNLGVVLYYSVISLFPTFCEHRSTSSMPAHASSAEPFWFSNVHLCASIELDRAEIITPVRSK